MFAKTYTKKQMGVIYRAVKEGKLSLEKGAVGYLYDMCGGMEVWNTDQQRFADKLYYGMRLAIDAIFAGNYEEAQGTIDSMVAA